MLFPTKISDSFLVKKHSRSKAYSGGGPNKRREDEGSGGRKKLVRDEKGEQLPYNASVVTDLADDS